LITSPTFCTAGQAIAGEQPIPRAPRQGYITFTLPAGGSSAWLSVYRDVAKSEVGLFLSCFKNSPAETAVNAVV